MNIINTEIPSRWLVGAKLNWVTSVSNETSDSGVRSPVARQTRPLMQIVFDVRLDDVVAVENLYISCNGPANGFFARPPIDRYFKVAGKAIGTATGSAQNIQLTIIRGQTWNVIYVVTATVVVYSNGVALSGSDWSLVEATGVLTVTSTAGHALTIDFQWKTAFQFVDEQLQIELKTNYQVPQQITILEIP